MITLSGLLIILAFFFGILKQEKWAWYFELSQGILYAVVTLLLIIMQPRVSVLGFTSEIILFLAILTDACIALFILVPLAVNHDNFF